MVQAVKVGDGDLSLPETSTGLQSGGRAQPQGKTDPTQKRLPNEHLRKVWFIMRSERQANVGRVDQRESPSASHLM